MLFNSHEFIFIFLPITFLIYFYLNSRKLTEISKGFLVFSSLFFYSWWNILYLPLILMSMLFNYVLGNSLSKYKDTKRTFSKKNILIFGIISNLSLLGYFKYSDFFIENVNFLTNSQIPTLNLALPLAISFFTFQQIAYLVDSYRSETHEYDFLNYAIFVTFFPQLIAGPIVHHKEMMPQFEKISNKVKNYRNIAAGLFIFSLGLFKKVVIADTFAVWATTGFDTAVVLNLFEAWATSLSYTFQLYFDFSGYTDMAIGAALLFNIKLPINFNSPYKALSIQDFWRRWHMTLSRFMKDYIYIPLGGNKKGNFRAFTNLFSVALISGLWHGAGWTFVVWGALHGIALVIHKAWSNLGFKLWTWLAWFITFNFVNIAWIFFRAKDWESAFKVLSAMFSLDFIVLPSFLESKLYFLTKYKITFSGFIENIQGGSPYFILWFIFAFIIISLNINTNTVRLMSLNFKSLLFIIVISMISLLNISSNSEFLYFNF